MKLIIGIALFLLIFTWGWHLFQWVSFQQAPFENEEELPTNVVSVESDTCNPPDTRPHDAYMSWWNEQMQKDVETPK